MGRGEFEYAGEGALFVAPVTGIVRLPQNRLGCVGRAKLSVPGRGLLHQRPGRFQVVAKLARSSHGNESESGSTDHVHPAAAAQPTANRHSDCSSGAYPT
jgi:hypothetical protein